MKQKLIWLFVAVMLGLAPCATLTSCGNSKSKTEKSGKKKKKKKDDSTAKSGDEEETESSGEDELEFDEDVLDQEIIVEDNGTSEGEIDLTEPESNAQPSAQPAQNTDRKLNVPESQNSSANNANRQLIERIVANEAKSLPKELEQGLTWVQATLRGNEVVYLYEVNEKQNMLLSSDLNKKKQEIIQWIANDKNVHTIVNAIMEENMNVRYIYFGTHTRKTASIVLTSAALRKAMK